MPQITEQDRVNQVIGYSVGTIDRVAKLLDTLSLKGIENAQILADVVKLLMYGKVPVQKMPTEPVIEKPIEVSEPKEG